MTKDIKITFTDKDFENSNLKINSNNYPKDIKAFYMKQIIEF